MSKPFSTWRPHPWHGLEAGNNAPDVVQAFVEITPFDTVKFEVDKHSGYLRVDRSQRSSSLPPSLYGFIPQTYAAERVAALMSDAPKGDHDPLDICVLSERHITRAEVLVNAVVVGGLPMIDDEEADDKIIAIMKNDPMLGHITDINDVPEVLVERLIHYFSTYKQRPNQPSPAIIGNPYGSEHARKVVLAGMADYQEHFGAA